MSYTIVKSLSTFRKTDGKWYVRATSACNNVCPRHYSKFEGSVGYDDRNEIDGKLIGDFEDGGLRGSCDYSLFDREIRCGLARSNAWNSLVTLRKIFYDSAWDYLRKFRDTPEKQKASERIDRIRGRLSLWENEIYPRLGRDFRAWNPDKRRFKAFFNGGCVTKITKGKYGGFSLRYTPGGTCGSEFPAVLAFELRKFYAEHGREIVLEEVTK